MGRRCVHSSTLSGWVRGRFVHAHRTTRIHFGQESDGGAILDSTVNSSSMMFHPVFDFGLFGYQIANLLIRRCLSLSPQELVFQEESSKANPTEFCILGQVSGQVALLRLVLLNR